MSHTAELIAVGTEILLGNIANTDAQMLSEELAALGVNVLYHTVVGDNPTRLAEALELARRRVDILITTGGLGPTYDDLTKQTICTVFGRKNIFHPEIADALRTHFASIGRELTENNLRQAYLPEGCTIFHNHNGTAPGCGFCEGGVHVLMLPGPPHECRKMFRTGAIPYLRTLSDEIIVSHSLLIYGQGESQIEAMLHDRIASMVNPSVAPYAKPDECMLRVTAKAKSEAEAEEMLRGAIEEVMPVIGEWVYGYDPRVAKIEDKYYVTWCNGYHGPTIGIAWTDDFETFHQLENAFIPFNRNGVLFPRKIGGKFAMLSRPSDNGHTAFGDIFYSESPDMEFWGRHRHVMSPAAFEVSAWQCMKVGAGPVPIETSEGWLLFYHGVLRSCNGYVYAFGSALLDLDQPWKVIARSGPYLISPREIYELTGDVPNVTFPCAALHDPATGRVAVYYGCADTVTGLAFGYIPEIVEFTKKNNIL